MYRVLIADDDILMREALDLMVTREEGFKVIQMVDSGEQAVKACRENPVDIVFMDMQMPGITGLEASRIIQRANPEIEIYILSAHAASVLIRSAGQDSVKDVLEKPITKASLRKILENYKTEHENSVQGQMETLVEVLRHKDFGELYEILPGIIDEIYVNADLDSAKLIKIFTYLGQRLLDTRNIYDDNKNVTDIFPIMRV